MEKYILKKNRKIFDLLIPKGTVFKSIDEFKLKDKEENIVNCTFDENVLWFKIENENMSTLHSLNISYFHNKPDLFEDIESPIEKLIEPQMKLNRALAIEQNKSKT